MTCDDRIEPLALYATGDLPQCDRAEFETHLASCEACRHELDVFRSQCAVLGTLNENAIPSADFEALTARVAQLPGRRLKRVQRIQVVALAACAVLVVVLELGGFWMTRSGAGGEEQRMRPDRPILAQTRSVGMEARLAVPTEDEAASLAPAKQDRVLAKFLTDDPKIVIIWLTNDEQESGR